MKRFLERLIEGLLTLSGSLTSITILLIVIFLFKEGVGLFNSPTIEKGYVLSVNQSNSVDQLSPIQVKEIFDSEITNWDQVGGSNDDIMIFRFDEIFSIYSEEEIGSDFENLPTLINKVVVENKNIIAFLPDRYLPIDFQGILLKKEIGRAHV